MVVDKISYLVSATYGCETRPVSWTMPKQEENKITAFGNKCARKTLGVPWTAKMTNETVWSIIKAVSSILQIVKSRKLQFFGHVIRNPEPSIEKTIITGLVPGTRSVGHPHTAWIDNIQDWTKLSGSNLLQAAVDRSKWRRIIHHRDQPSVLMTV